MCIVTVTVRIQSFTSHTYTCHTRANSVVFKNNACPDHSGVITCDIFFLTTLFSETHMLTNTHPTATFPSLTPARGPQNIFLCYFYLLGKNSGRHKMKVRKKTTQSLKAPDLVMVKDGDDSTTVRSPTSQLVDHTLEISPIILSSPTFSPTLHLK